MTTQRYLANAPIVEAIVDFRVKLTSGFDVNKFLSLKASLAQDYPTSEEKWAYQGEFRFSKEQSQGTVKGTKLLGYLFKSADGKNVVQFRVDGFTFSRLHPYTDWDMVLAEAKKTWELYQDLARPEIVHRLATRYINRMDIPLPIDFEQYLTAAPRIPEGLPQEVTRFFSTVGIVDPDSKILATIIQTMERSKKPKHMSIILDIDAYIVMESGFTTDQIWPNFDLLRTTKNRIFFQSITEKTVRLFE